MGESEIAGEESSGIICFSLAESLLAADVQPAYAVATSAMTRSYLP